jgi:hypothetical protein
VHAQPFVAEDQVRVAVHRELHEGRLLVEAAERQPPRHRAARRAHRAVRLLHRGVPRRCGAAARERELGRELQGQKAVRGAGIE